MLGAAHAATIYEDNFDGLAADNLIGTTPDTTQSSNTWDNSTSDATNITADGSVADGHNTGNWLAFAPTSGQIYTLSADVNTAAASDENWISLGFTSGNGNVRFTESGAKGLGSILLRGDRGTDPTVQGQYFAGADTGGPTGFNSPTGPVSFNIILDATDADAANWTTSLQVNGTNVALGSNQPDAGDYSAISYAGFSVTSVLPARWTTSA